MATVPCLALLALLLTAAAAEGRIAWNLKGGGYGHGIGMSQYGAYGFAQHGYGYGAILKHYFTGVTLGTTSASKIVRVLLRPNASSVSFHGATSACGAALNESTTYTATRSGGTVVLKSGGTSIGSCGGMLSATGGDSVILNGKGTYHGALEIRPASGPGLNAINAVGIEDYAKGVVAKEMPALWSIEALKAQAVAVRSYALSTGVGGNGYTQYDDTRSQAYGGVGAETARTNSAVAATNLQVVLYGGKVATTYFFSTSGGHTENIEYSFVGSPPVPYLKGVDDPYDTISPYHAWTLSVSQARMQSLLSRYLKGGRLRKIKVTQRGTSPRVVYAVLIGSAGKARVSGPALKAALGLRDSWVYFKKLKR